MAKTNKVKEVLAKIELIKKAMGEIIYVDDHNGGKNLDKATGYIVIRKTNGTEHVCCVPAKADGTTAPVFCLNPLYVDDVDGKLHLSTWSVGGNIDLRYKSAAQVIEEYNKDQFEYDTIVAWSFPSPMSAVLR